MLNLRTFSLMLFLMPLSLFANDNLVTDQTGLSSLDASLSMVGSELNVYGKKTVGQIAKAIGSICDSAGDISSPHFNNLTDGARTAINLSNLARTMAYLAPDKDKKTAEFEGNRGAISILTEAGLRIGSVIASWYASYYADNCDIANVGGSHDDLKKRIWAGAMVAKNILRAGADVVSSGSKSISGMTSMASAVLNSAAALSIIKEKKDAKTNSSVVNTSVANTNVAQTGGSHVTAQPVVNVNQQIKQTDNICNTCLLEISSPEITTPCNCYSQKGKRHCLDCFCGLATNCLTSVLKEVDHQISTSPEAKYQKASYDSNRMGLSWFEINGQIYFELNGHYWRKDASRYHQDDGSLCWIAIRTPYCDTCRAPLRFEWYAPVLQRHSGKKLPVKIRRLS